MAGRYEALRHVAVSEGPAAAGLAGALLMGRGMASWMRGWRACVPAVPSRGGHAPAAQDEVVGVLTAMALACA